MQNETFEFEWDSGNSTKSKDKHGIETEEVESVFHLKGGVSLGRQVSPPVLEERLCVVGLSSSGRMLYP